MSKKVLVVDDEPAIREIGKRLLLEAGYDCYMGINGETGLDALRRYEIDLIITDFNMPGMNGTEFAHRVRETGYRGKILLACSGADDIMKKSGGVYFDDFINKPPGIDIYLQKVRKLIGDPESQ